MKKKVTNLTSAYEVGVGIAQENFDLLLSSDA